MGFDIIYPKISAITTEGKIEDVKSYLYQLVEQLNWVLSTIDNSIQDVQPKAEDTFNSIKPLIYEVINEKLVGEYVAKIDSYSNKDFNELVYKTGYYTGTSAPSSALCTNYPINEIGVLEVISVMSKNKETLDWWGFAYQTYRTHTGLIYVRSYSSSSTGWTEWKQITLT